jgi:hypothetical protein
MKKQTGKTGARTKVVTMPGRSSGKVHEIVGGHRKKGPKPQKLLPPWREVKDELE